MAYRSRPLQRRRQSIPALVTAGLLALGGTAGTSPARAAEATSAGAKGAQVYCFMRANGNNHEVSWVAAYALIKRQGSSMFRTSPEHAAVMITEAVVENPTTFPDCGRYLGDLYSRRARSVSTAPAGEPAVSAQGSGNAGGGGLTRSERYAN
jgi:hypothetical protein